MTELTRKEILKKAVKYFNGDDLAAEVWLKKYALQDTEKIYETTPDEMHHRLAKEFSRIENKYINPMSEEEIYNLLKDFKYIIPQGSPMAGVGNDYQIVSLSNCFVIGNNGSSDSYGGILKTDEEQAQIMKRRGGVGHDLSHIRPKGSSVKNCALTSAGIVPFMERFSNTTREVAQGGRRGALMLTISIKHPDVEDFINAKLEQGKITGANISVKITDEFMDCVRNNKPFIQQFPIDSDNPIIKKEVNARKLWDKIIYNAWKSAEPGVVYWDTIINESLADCYSDLGYKTVSLNPCGELPLCAYDSCRLQAINLYSYVKNPFTSDAEFDEKLFISHVKKGQRLMDDLIDLELEKIDSILAKIDRDPEDLDIKSREITLWKNIREKCINGRRTGFGITALGDMLAALGWFYGKDGAIVSCDRIFQLFATSAYESSVQLAKERGAFPIYDKNREKNNPYINRLFNVDPQLKEDMYKYGRRNIACLTIAPTGSVSMLTQTTSGIEPVFLISYKRRKRVVEDDIVKSKKKLIRDDNGDLYEEFYVFHPKFIKWLEINGYDVEKVKNMSDMDLQEIINESPYYHSTSQDIDWVQKVKMQGVIQKWIDHSISVTVNVPKDTPKETVNQIYMTAWESCCKGCTIYREGSRQGVLVAKDENKETDFKEKKAPKRPKELVADVLRFKNDREDWIAFVGIYDGHPYEIFTGKAECLAIPKNVDKGKIIRIKDANQEHARYDFKYKDCNGEESVCVGLSNKFNQEFWNYAKLISGVLRQGMPTENAIDLISKLQFNEDSINTWKNGVQRALKRYIKDGKETGETCPDCGQPLVYTSGCKSCPNCGWSKCS